MILLHWMMCLTSTLEKLVLRNVTHLKETWTKLYTLTVWEKPLRILV